jgi:hypothetical protein
LPTHRLRNGHLNQLAYRRGRRRQRRE